jgi:hypothetical protein
MSDATQEFQQRFVDLWAVQGQLYCQINHTVFGQFHLPENTDEDEVADYDGFGYDNFEYRLIVQPEVVRWYAWCWNSHGSTHIRELPKESFLQKITVIVTGLDSLKGSERYKTWTRLWEASGLDVAPVIGQANWN